MLELAPAAALAVTALLAAACFIAAAVRPGPGARRA